MMNFLKIGVASLLLVNGSVFADCQATIVNNSAKAWTFNLITDFPGENNCNPCIISPGTSFSLHYPKIAQGKMYIIDSTAARWEAFYFSNQRIKYEEKTRTSYYYNEGCPYIRHQGNTGAVSVNEPQDGSFVIDKDTWDKE